MWVQLEYWNPHTTLKDSNGIEYGQISCVRTNKYDLLPNWMLFRCHL